MGVSVKQLVDPRQRRWSRREAIVGGLALALCACARPRERRVTTVLFVCQFGTVRSAVAREVFRQRARDRGIRVSAVSRGITPEHHASAELMRELIADGIDPNKDGLQALSPQDWRRADIVVVFNPLPDEARPRDLRDWADLPSFNDHYAQARPLLAARVDALLDEIANGQREAI